MLIQASCGRLSTGGAGGGTDEIRQKKGRKLHKDCELRAAVKAKNSTMRFWSWWRCPPRLWENPVSPTSCEWNQLMTSVVFMAWDAAVIATERLKRESWSFLPWFFLFLINVPRALLNQSWERLAGPREPLDNKSRQNVCTRMCSNALTEGQSCKPCTEHHLQK